MTDLKKYLRRTSKPFLSKFLSCLSLQGAIYDWNERDKFWDFFVDKLIGLRIRAKRARSFLFLPLKHI
jgi:hypothetical protein